jgi:hypothetical protein
MRKLLVLTFAIALLGAACGDSDSDSESGATSDDPRVAQVAEILKGDQEFPISDSEANCVANRTVSDLSDDEVQLILDNPDAGPEILDDPASAATMLDGLFDCIDMEAFMVNGMVADGTPEDVARCVADGFGEDEIRGFLEIAMNENAADDDSALEILGKFLEVGQDCGLEL